jgi:hypothetical protein
MEITLTLESSDNYRPMGLGVAGATTVLYVERPGGTDLAILGEPSELRRLARALDDAATGEGRNGQDMSEPPEPLDLQNRPAGTPEPQ